MNVDVVGLGIWARGLCSHADLVHAMANGGVAADAAFLPPKPEAIPARERRRAGLMINLAVTVAHQACEHAGVDKSDIPSVFVSSMGDTDITDYMCRKLAQPEKLLSPTKFHNSVHNAPSGYWTISAENRAPSTFVGGDVQSFGAGLLEAASQVEATAQPVLLVAYDIANHAPFADVAPISESFAVALVLAPPQSASASNGMALNLDIDLVSGASMQAQSGAFSEVQNAGLGQLATSNPIARSLALLEQLVNVQQATVHAAQVTLPAATRLGLALHIQAA